MSKSLAKIEKLNGYVQKAELKIKTLKSEVEHAKKELSVLKQNVLELEEKLEEERTRYKILSMAKSFGSDQEKQIARGKVNEFIREIDKCIALLNK
ncbi:MAG: hypothetical protein ACXITV_04225 [Luteibaculaceae bacterium]